MLSGRHVALQINGWNTEIQEKMSFVLCLRTVNLCRIHMQKNRL